MINLALWVASAIFLALVGWFLFCMIGGAVLEVIGSLFPAWISQPKRRT